MNTFNRASSIAFKRLESLSLEEVTIVLSNKSRGSLEFHQEGRNVRCDEMSYFFSHRFTNVAVMMPEDLARLLGALEYVSEDNAWSEHTYISPGEFAFKVYSTENCEDSLGPDLEYDVNLRSLSSKLALAIFYVQNKLYRKLLKLR